MLQPGRMTKKAQEPSKKFKTIDKHLGYDYCITCHSDNLKENSSNSRMRVVVFDVRRGALDHNYKG